MEAIVKQLSNMRVIKLKENWDFNDENLVVNDRFTSFGTTALWKALDSTFKFNVLKRDKFLAREMLKHSDLLPRKSAKLMKTDKPGQSVDFERQRSKDEQLFTAMFSRRRRQEDRAKTQTISTGLGQPPNKVAGDLVVRHMS